MTECIKQKAAFGGLSQQVADAQEYPVNGSDHTISCSGNVLATSKLAAFVMDEFALTPQGQIPK